MLNLLLYYLSLVLALIFGGLLIGKYLARILNATNGEQFSWCLALEKRIYRLASINSSQEMDWKTYTWALLIFNGLGLILLFLLQYLQHFLPLNPMQLPNVRWDTAFNTAVSFMTNTNRQAYSGETTMSYLTQMTGLTVQNFLSAATGLAALLAVTRGFVRKNTALIGNFWVDLTRITLYLLLPLALVLSLLLVSQGVVQTLKPYVVAETIDGDVTDDRRWARRVPNCH